MALTREGNALFYLGGGQKNVSVNVLFFLSTGLLPLWFEHFIVYVSCLNNTIFLKAGRYIIDFPVLEA